MVGDHVGADPPRSLARTNYFFTVATYRGFAPAGYVGFVFGLACGSIVLTWLYYGTGGSILACAV